MTSRLGGRLSLIRIGAAGVQRRPSMLLGHSRQTFMRTALIRIIALLLCIGASSTSTAANWSECNGTPVRPKYPPMGLFWDQCSIPEGSAQERAFFSALYETRNYVTALGFGGGY